MSELYRGDHAGILPELDEKFGHLMRHGYFDTAIRELAVHLESEMRVAVGGDSYGTSLVREYFDTLERSDVYISAYLKVLKQNVRSAFKFVRNEFAHKVVELDETRAVAIAGRMSRSLFALKSINGKVNLREK